MAYTKYSLTPANNTAAPPDGAPEGMLPSAVNDTMRDMMAQIRDCGDGIRGGTYTMTAPIITGGTINGATIGATTASTGKFTAVTNSALTSGRVTYAGTAGVLQDDADFTFNGTTVTMANDASISGLTVGKGGGAVSSNTAFGVNALTANEAGGTNNTAIGNAALDSNTTGDANTALGQDALQANTTASNNTAVGYQAGYTNTTGGNFTAVGKEAGYTYNSTTENFGSTFVGLRSGQSTTTGNDNAFVGGFAGRFNTTGSYNVALGASSLYSNTTASNNTAVGYQAGYSNTTGTIITAIGRQALYNNTTGTDNTALGYAMVSNTTGSQNTGIGAVALQLNTTGTNNTAMGYQALDANTTGDSNTAVGVNALGAQTTASSNTAIGVGSGGTITTGTKNSILGRYDGNQGSLDIRTSSNYIVLSDGDGNPRAYWDNNGRLRTTANVSDDAMLITNAQSSTPYGLRIEFSAAAPNNTTQKAIEFGDSSAYRFRVWSNGNVVNSNNSYGSISDVSLKENIINATPKLDKLMDVQVRNYNLIGETQKQIGVVAQELEEVFPSMVDIDGESGLKQVKYSVFVPMLIKAVQELNAKVEAQALEIAQLKGN